MARFKATIKKNTMLYVEHIPSEYDECLTFYQWTQWHPRLKGNVIKIVNEGKRSVVQGARLKAIGLSKGEPDYIIPVPNRKYHSLWLEVKTVDERLKKQKKEQIEKINRLLKLGHYATFAFGASQCIQITTDYLNNML